MIVAIIGKINPTIEDYKKEITRLNDENKQYKEYIKELKDSLRNYHIKNNKLINKNDRLNNIIEELEKYHIESMKNLENTEDFKYIGINHIKILYEEHKRTLDKLKELGSNFEVVKK